MTLVRNIAHNTIIQLVGKAAGISFSVVTIGIITRYLGLTEFGYYTTILVFLHVFSILIDFGLQMSAVRIISDPAKNESDAFSNVFTIRVISSLVFMCAAPAIALLFPYPAEVKNGIVVAAIAFFFMSTITVLVSIFQKKLRMGKVALADFLGKFFFFVFVFYSVYYDFGLLGILWSTAASSALQFAILLYFSKKLSRLRLLFQWNDWLEILKKTWPIALTIALNLIYFKADTIILSLFQSQADVGMYGAPYKLLEVIIGLAYMFLGLLLPLFTYAFAKKNMEYFKKILQSGYDAMIIIIIPMIIGTLFIGRDVMTLIAGQSFGISGDILKILMLATGAIFLAGLFGYAIVAMDRQKEMIVFYGINAVLSLVGYLVFIPRYSYWAAAWLTVFTEGFILVTAFYVLYKHIRFVPRMGTLVKSVFSSFVMGLVLYFLSEIHTFASLILSILVYFVVLLLIGGIPKYILLQIIKIRK